MPAPTRCVICHEPLPPRRWWDKLTDWLLSPPPFCRDTDACQIRFFWRVDP